MNQLVVSLGWMNWWVQQTETEADFELLQFWSKHQGKLQPTDALGSQRYYKNILWQTTPSAQATNNLRLMFGWMIVSDLVFRNRKRVRRGTQPPRSSHSCQLRLADLQVRCLNLLRDLQDLHYVVKVLSSPGIFGIENTWWPARTSSSDFRSGVIMVIGSSCLKLGIPGEDIFMPNMLASCVSGAVW